MNIQHIEKIFKNSWLSLDKKKFILTFFTLCLCGVIVVFSRVLAIGASTWVFLSLSILPLFISTSLLFALGVLLVRMYRAEEEGLGLGFFQIVLKSMKPLVSICYITLPLLLVYVLSWVVLGVFFLAKEIPGVGDFIGVFLSFGPFVLILGSLFLSFLSVAVLFFMTPVLASKEQLTLNLWKQVGTYLQKNMFLNFAFLTLSALPLFFILSFLIGAAYLTKMCFFVSQNPLLVGLQWFFLMLPFNALLSPFIVFFFNFSYETHSHLFHEAVEQPLVKNTVHSV